MFTTILVPTDGSAGAEATIDHALDLGRTYEAEIHSLYVVETGGTPAGLAADDREELYAPSERRGREATIRITDEAEAHDLRAAREVREGVPHRTILEYVDEQAVDMIIMGTHGRTGADRARLGSTTERVLALSDVPVLSVRLTDDGDAPAPTYDRIVIPTDGSDAAERAAENALEIADKYDADVHTVYVIDTTTYDLEDAPRSIIGLLKEGGKHATETVAEMARDRQLDVTTDVRRGVPAEELLEYVSSVDVDLIAMGTRGRAVGSGRLLGSTTARVVRRSSVPVLTVD
ncbi:universal stress protein [Natronorubrum thiooxidans]|uniref:Nucleotide-binding universal stress protein, UspA family n=1 Tax=Natronorubrum thiooxidans TaxID=308853 RepID=A0A1N7DJE3_9EURY|nr:universal stress protein [Natronorubrum thiooxidans]SIR75942.1 Nucleotide-binding universal stress protein, UspA family [Natronorubrum thiooxidans]